MEVIAYEMEYSATLVEKCNITCIPFESQYFPEYMKIYNECFYEMRKALDIEPYNYLSEYKQIAEKAANVASCLYSRFRGLAPSGYF